MITQKVPNVSQLIVIISVALPSFLLCPKLLRIMFKPFYKYLETNGILPSSQYAYREKLSTCDAILDISSLAQQNHGKGYKTRIAQVDFSATFDLVNHNAFIFKLRQIDIAFQMSPHIFCDRQQRVLINSAASDLEPVVSRVPQGSVFGPVVSDIYSRFGL